jgi:predicted ATPase/class 3 adenylate cyclase
VTFLLTDIEGSTAQWERSGDAFRAALAAHHALLRREFHRHGGLEVKEAGDSFLAAFASAGDALACAVAGQRALAGETWPAETGPLFVRMAIHSGDVELANGEYHGIVLHRASRILAAAHGGQVLCSEATSALLRRDLETEIRLRDVGVYRLRDVESPERLFQVDFAGMARQEFPAVRAERAHSGSLPLQFTRFFGRESEIERLRELLLAPETRLVTLTGPGGTGKTRLSIEAAGQMVDAFSGAVWFVPVADVSDARLIPETILEALQITPAAGADPLEQAVAFLSQQPSLVILDNLEQVAEAGADLVELLLSRCPTLTCLVTSRQILGLPMEREFPVPPLATPGSDTGGSPEGLGVYESVRLFVDRAQAVKPDFQVTNANAPAVAELCDRLEGIPLAIELAAARAQVLTPQQMLQQLGNRFELLVSRRRGVAERQRTLRAAVDWSYRLLSPELQEFFKRLCVLRGGWTVAAAEAVCDDPLALDHLAQLRECSLVVTEEGCAEMRFRMLETLREYACGHIGASDLAAAEERHALYFLAYAERAEAELRGAAQSVWLARLEEDRENLRRAIAWTHQESRLEEALRLGGALWYFWSIRSHFAEGRRILDETLALVQATHPALGRSVLRAHALLGAGALAHDQSHYADAARLLDESMGLMREHAERAGLAAALNIRANVALDQGQTERAMALYQEALGLFRESGNARGASIVLSNLGVLALDEGDLDRAATLLSDSVQLKRKLGNAYGLANSLESLGNVERSRGELGRAATLYEEALTIRQGLGNRHGAAVAQNNLAHTRLLGGEVAAARLHLEEALATFVELGEMRGLCESLALLAGAAAAEGRAQAAARVHGTVEHAVQVSEAERAAEEGLLSPARNALGPEGMQKEAERGRGLGAEDAAALVRGEPR